MRCEIIYNNNNKPYGIRNKNGFLFFFTEITKYINQEIRYQNEIKSQFDLADFIEFCLNNEDEILLMKNLKEK